MRVYNAAWNYYAGMSESEIEADLRRDTVWQRPSWPLGGRGPSRIRPEVIIEGFGFFEGEARRAPAPPPSPRQEALEIFELQPPLTIAAVKARYKQLVKIHHPDANGGDKASEERFKQIAEAYHMIMEDLAS